MLRMYPPIQWGIAMVSEFMMWIWKRGGSRKRIRWKLPTLPMWQSLTMGNACIPLRILAWRHTPLWRTAAWNCWILLPSTGWEAVICPRTTRTSTSLLPVTMTANWPCWRSSRTALSAVSLTKCITRAWAACRNGIFVLISIVPEWLMTINICWWRTREWTMWTYMLLIREAANCGLPMWSAAKWRQHPGI